MRKKTKLILALDVLSYDKAMTLVRSIGDLFDAIKIGYPLILAIGLEIIKEIAMEAPVIADLKIADIPSTNRLICDQVLGAGASGIIAHAFTGRDSLEACARSARDHNADLFAVTEMSHPGASAFMAPVAEIMAKMAVEARASGVVAPATRPERIASIRRVVGDLIIISPGVGAQGGSAAAALAAGADYLILGRSVYEAADPARATLDILDSIKIR